MANPLSALLEVATDLHLHRHFLRELRKAEGRPLFSSLPPIAKERHRLLLLCHEEACERLSQEGILGPEPTLVEALVAYLERQEEPIKDHPTARHLNTVRAVLGRSLYRGEGSRH